MVMKAEKLLKYLKAKLNPFYFLQPMNDFKNVFIHDSSYIDEEVSIGKEQRFGISHTSE